MTTGKLPFPGDDPMTIFYALANSEPSPPHTVNDAVPPELSDLIVRLLAKDPGQRAALPGCAIHSDHK